MCLFTLVCMIINTSHLKLYRMYLCKKKSYKGEDTPGLYRNSELPSWRQREAAMWHSSNGDTSVSLGKGQLPSPEMSSHHWWGPVLQRLQKGRSWFAGEDFVMAGAAPHPGTAKPPRTARFPSPCRAWSCLSLLPLQARQRDPCLKAEEDSWEHEWAKGNERTATTRWLMAPIWTLLTAQSLGTSAETD